MAKQEVSKATVLEKFLATTAVPGSISVEAGATVDIVSVGGDWANVRTSYGASGQVPLHCLGLDGQVDHDFLQVAQITLLGDGSRGECIGKAAWILEDGLISERLARDYPSSMDARRDFIRWAKANQWYQVAIWMMIPLSIMEVPPWCDSVTGFWESRKATHRCFIPADDFRHFGGNHTGHDVKTELLLSGFPYLAPGVTLTIELILLMVIATKLFLEWKVQAQHFKPLQVNYFPMPVVYISLCMLILELLDMAYYCFIQCSATFGRDEDGMHYGVTRISFIPRVMFLICLPKCLVLLQSILQVIQEFLTIVVIFIGCIVLSAWISFELLHADDQINEGYETFSDCLNSMFIAGATDDFYEKFSVSYEKNRVYGILWLVFLIIVHVLLLSLTLDTLVSGYKTINETTEEKSTTEKARGVYEAFLALVGNEPGEEKTITKAAFQEFCKEYSKSPLTTSVTDESADIIFRKANMDSVAEGGEGYDGEAVDMKGWIKICTVMQMNPVITTKASPVKDVFPRLWESRYFTMLRNSVNDGSFSAFFTGVLILNLLLMITETYMTSACHHQHKEHSHMCKEENKVTSNLELAFSLIYVIECGVKLCVWSPGEYFSSGANNFDFWATWLLLSSSLLEFIAGSGDDDDDASTGGTTTVQGPSHTTSIKKLMGILRLLRLVRMIKQLSRFKRIQFMMATVMVLISKARYILGLLIIVLFFFTSLSVQLWGGLLYQGVEALQETEYAEKGYWVLNFNDWLMGFGVWVVLLLCEYKQEFADAISATDPRPNTWLIFLLFYFCGVMIIFELVKAVTIEVFVELFKENAIEEKKKIEKKKEKEKAAHMKKVALHGGANVAEGAEEGEESEPLSTFAKIKKMFGKGEEEEEEEEDESIARLQHEMRDKGKELHVSEAVDKEVWKEIAEELEELEHVGLNAIVKENGREGVVKAFNIGDEMPFKVAFHDGGYPEVDFFSAKELEMQHEDHHGHGDHAPHHH